MLVNNNTTECWICFSRKKRNNHGTIYDGAMDL